MPREPLVVHVLSDVAESRRGGARSGVPSQDLGCRGWQGSREAANARRTCHVHAVRWATRGSSLQVRACGQGWLGEGVRERAQGTGEVQRAGGKLHGGRGKLRGNYSKNRGGRLRKSHATSSPPRPRSPGRARGRSSRRPPRIILEPLLSARAHAPLPWGSRVSASPTAFSLVC